MIPLSYNVRSLLVRARTTVSTAFGLALVVFVFAAVLMFSNGLRSTLSRSAGSNRVIVLRKGASAELDSQYDARQLSVVFTADQLAREADGSARGLTSLVVSATLEGESNGPSGTWTLLLRGIPQESFGESRNLNIIAGRLPQAGADEAILGDALRGRLGGLDLHGTIPLPRGRELEIVGIFSSAGSVFESEVWTHADVLQGAYSLENQVSSASLELKQADQFDSFKSAIEDNRQLGLQVRRESEFFENQAGGANTLIRGMALMLAILFSLAATLGAAITMHAAVASRHREIGVLRALGFTRAQVVASMLVESTMLAVSGGLLGALGALALGFVRFSMFNHASRGMVVFTFTPSADTITLALAMSLGMGLLGGLFPAVRAARVSPVSAMRQ